MSDLELGKCPFSNPKLDQIDNDKCPYLQMQNQKKTEKILEQTNLGSDELQKKKKKKNKGGCPIMSSEKKRNPPLDISMTAYNINYISQFHCVLNFGGSYDIEKRRIFDSYPIYLKHSIFFDEEEMVSLRKLEISQRFFVYDQFREQGNKQYYLKNYQDAISFYERALSCFKWIEVIDVSEDKNDLQQEKQREIRKKYRNFLTDFNDKNTRVIGSEQEDEIFNSDMRDSLIFNILLNISSTYIQLNHYEQAKEALKDAFTIKSDNSLGLFRMSQAITLDRGSKLQELKQALSYIEQAIEVQPTEKLFLSPQPAILFNLNLHNIPDIYHQLKSIIVERIDQQTQFQVSKIGEIMARERELEEIEKELIEDGRDPIEYGAEQDMGEPIEQNLQSIRQQEHQEFEIVKDMVKKYYQVIEFHQEQKRKDQVSLATKQLQSLLEVYHEMLFYLDLDFLEWETNTIIKLQQDSYQLDLSNPKVQRRLLRIQRDQMKELFSSYNFNFEMFQYSLKDYFRRKRENSKKKQNNEKPHGQKIIQQIFRLEFAIQAFITLIVFSLIYISAKAFIGNNVLMNLK